jgi:hypothetical protein
MLFHFNPGESHAMGYEITEPGEIQLEKWLRKHGFIK